jgi:hypothetical protein
MPTLLFFRAPKTAAMIAKSGKNDSKIRRLLFNWLQVPQIRPAMTISKQ